MTRCCSVKRRLNDQVQRKKKIERTGSAIEQKLEQTGAARKQKVERLGAATDMRCCVT